MTGNWTEDLIQELEKVCEDFSETKWLNIKAAEVPWLYFPKIDESLNRSSKELIDESEVFIKFFYER